MGNACTGNRPVTRTTILTKPLLKPTGEVIYSGVPKQTVEEDLREGKTSPLYIRKLHTWAQENAEHHHTSRFELPRSGTLVVRRGQPFKVTLAFNRPYNSLTDELKFYFETGEKPLPGNNTMVCLSSYTSKGSSGWKSDFLPVIGTRDRDCQTVNLWVFTPHDCIVGDWKFSLQCILRSESDSATVTYEHPDRIYILFNPWCKKDVVYYPAEPMLEEYILNASGLLFLGCKTRVTFKPWIFGQFESGILEACIYLVKRAFNFRTSQLMGDAAIVARNVARIVCADEPGGVLQGKWHSDSYEGGRSPTTWSGSVAILKQYVDNALGANGDIPDPVKYGHCFVYAGLVTTICRAVGIPCRCVTNYDSGRDSDANLSIDFYYELSEDQLISEMDNNEGVWGFHIWNDVWMRRPDLGQPYSVDPDWQALDATPYVSSANGLHSCGPAPLVAIKNGHTDIKYDVNFMLASVNAEVVHWLKLSSAAWTVFKVEDSRIGRSISTKTPDGRPPRLTFKYNVSEMARIRQDISSDYKYKKGTKSEQEAIQRPKKRDMPLHRCKANDVSLELVEKEYEFMGEDFYIKANVTNNNIEEARTVHVQLVCEAVHYTGRRHRLIKRQTFKESIDPAESITFKLDIYEDNYIDKLAEHTLVKQYVYIHVEETDQIQAQMGTFLLQKPHIHIQTLETAYRGKNLELKLFFKNPLHRPLSRCAVSVEGTGLESMLYVRNFENIPAQCEWTGVVNVMPLKARLTEVVVTFHCAQMFDLVGFTTIKVERGEEVEENVYSGSVSQADTDLNKSMSINV